MTQVASVDAASTSQVTTNAVGTGSRRTRRASPHEQLPTQLGERYLIEAELGRGGVAVVYRARDAASGRSLAIKRLAHAPGSKNWAMLSSLFEREFHLLAQLSHPRVIEVYDYAVEGGIPYYTMELLDGGDLRQLSPLPWRKVCELIYDVCSSLALLHSRRFVHRDISPLNVRCTRAGYAKLIDFGAAVPMGPVAQLVGTAPFVPPEALNRGVLDARADLYSLGATCYYALSGQLAYPARSFAELQERWGTAPLQLSRRVPEIPPALDELVMSLLSLDEALRPRSAFDVMQRLSAIAELPHAESLEVPRSYLSAPLMVGRDAPIARIRAKLSLGLESGSASMISAPRGAGRTRMLDASVLAAKALGARVLRAGAGHTRRPFSVAQRALEQLQESIGQSLWVAAQAEGVASVLFEAQPAVPSPPLNEAAADTAVLRDLGADPRERARIQAALETLLCALARTRPLVIAVDDVHDIDEASVGLLAALSARCQREHLVLVLAADSAATRRAPRAFEVLSRYCEQLELPALDRAASQALIESVFGDVPNVALISQQIYERARGNPGSTLSLAEWLVDRGVVRYEAGAWSLPQQLAAADIPADGEQAFAERLRQLSPLARELAAAQALAVVSVFSRQDYLALAAADGVARVERALVELVAKGILTSDGELYELTARELVHRTLLSEDAGQNSAVHRALTQVFVQPDKPLILAVEHMLACGLEAEGLARLMRYFSTDTVQEPTLDHVPVLPYSQLMRLYTQALRSAAWLRPRELGELRRRLLLLSVVDDASVYYQVASAWLEQLSRDSGLERWRALTTPLDPRERFNQAFAAARRHYEFTPEAERGYRPDEAIRFLAQFVVVSLAIAGRLMDRSLMNSLPALLEPFTFLSPALLAIWENSCGGRATQAAQRLVARTHHLRSFEQLASLSSTDFPYVRSMSNAIAFSLGATDATLGLFDSAERWIQMLDQDPMQRVNALGLRKIVALQQGDWERSQEYRKQAELLELQSNVRQMFVFYQGELVAHARAGDLAGVRHVRERIEALAENNPHMQPFVRLARGLFHQLRGDLVQAEQELTACLALSDPETHGERAPLQAFCIAAAAYVEVLADRDEYTRAYNWGLRALATLRDLEISESSWELERALALVEAKLPDLSAVATQRILSLIGVHVQLGGQGLRLGACYEARARIAIWSGDEAAAAQYARLTAHEYRYGTGSVLGARCEKLREEARLAGMDLRS